IWKWQRPAASALRLRSCPAPAPVNRSLRSPTSCSTRSAIFRPIWPGLETGVMKKPARSGLFYPVGSAQLAPQDLADIGFRQLVTEFDMTRALVAGQLVAAIVEDVLLGQRHVLAHHEHFRHFARLL